MKTGITFSAFDLLHAGHVKMLEDAKRECDYLICALQTDPTIDRPEKKQTGAICCRKIHSVKGV